VVYATRSSSGRLSRISRTEQVPSFQHCSRTRISAFDSRVAIDISYRVRRSYYIDRPTCKGSGRLHFATAE